MKKSFIAFLVFMSINSVMQTKNSRIAAAQLLNTVETYKPDDRQAITSAMIRNPEIA